MISATVAACALFGVDRSATSWPATFRLSEALKVAKRTSASPACAGAASASAPTTVEQQFLHPVLP